MRGEAGSRHFDFGLWYLREFVALSWSEEGKPYLDKWKRRIWGKSEWKISFKVGVCRGQFEVAQTSFVSS